MQQDALFITHQFDLSFSYLCVVHYVYIYIYICILSVIRSMLPSQVSNKTTNKMWVSQLLQYDIVSYLVCTHASEFCQTLFNTECRSLLPPVGTVHRWILRWLSTRCKVVDFKNAKRWFITFHDDSEATSLRITISQIIQNHGYQLTKLLMRMRLTCWIYMSHDQNLLALCHPFKVVVEWCWMEIPMLDDDNPPAYQIAPSPTLDINWQ